MQLIIVLAVLGLILATIDYHLREFMIEFRSFNFVTVHNANYGKARTLLRDVYDAVLAFDRL